MKLSLMLDINVKETSEDSVISQLKEVLRAGGYENVVITWPPDLQKLSERVKQATNEIKKIK